MVEVSAIREVVSEQAWDPIVKQTTVLASDYKVVQVAVAVFVLVSLASAYVYWRCANSSIDPKTIQIYNKMRAQIERTGQINTGINQFSTLQEMYDSSNKITPKAVDDVIEEI